jgi:hypothetical protein
VGADRSNYSYRPSLASYDPSSALYLGRRGVLLKLRSEHFHLPRQAFRSLLYFPQPFIREAHPLVTNVKVRFYCIELST